MREIPTIRYGCDHCRKTMSSRSRMRRHESTCAHDPAQRACLTCGHFTAGGNDGDDCEEGHRIGHPLTRNCEYWKAADHA